MSEHTKEPWHLFGKDLHVMGNDWSDAANRGIPHAQWTHNCSPEDARRIVACVNACAGVSNEVLETMALKPSLTALVDEYRTQLEKLLDEFSISPIEKKLLPNGETVEVYMVLKSSIDDIADGESVSVQPTTSEPNEQE